MRRPQIAERAESRVPTLFRSNIALRESGQPKKNQPIMNYMEMRMDSEKTKRFMHYLFQDDLSRLKEFYRELSYHVNSFEDVKGFIYDEDGCCWDPEDPVVKDFIEELRKFYDEQSGEESCVQENGLVLLEHPEWWMNRNDQFRLKKKLCKGDDDEWKSLLKKISALTSPSSLENYLYTEMILPEGYDTSAYDELKQMVTRAFGGIVDDGSADADYDIPELDDQEIKVLSIAQQVGLLQRIESLGDDGEKCPVPYLGLTLNDTLSLTHEWFGGDIPAFWKAMKGIKDIRLDPHIACESLAKENGIDPDGSSMKRFEHILEKNRKRLCGKFTAEEATRFASSLYGINIMNDEDTDDWESALRSLDDVLTFDQWEEENDNEDYGELACLVGGRPKRKKAYKAFKEAAIRRYNLS